MIKNCVNCGEPIERDKGVCPYCKTPYDVSGFNAEIGEIFGEITIGGRTCKVYLGNVEHYEVRDVPYYDEKGNPHGGKKQLKRKITLIEV